MSDDLLDRVIAPEYEEPPSDDELVERLLNEGERFRKSVNDDLAEGVAALVGHYELSDHGLTEEERALLWTLSGFMTWVNDSIAPVDKPVSGVDLHFSDPAERWIDSTER